MIGKRNMGVKNWKLAGNNLESQIETVQRKFSLPRPIAVYFAARGIGEDQIQKLTDASVKKCDELLAAKEKELMEI